VGRWRLAVALLSCGTRAGALEPSAAPNPVESAPSSAAQVAPSSAAQVAPASHPRGAFDAGSVDWRPEFRRVGWPEAVTVPLLTAGVLLQFVLLKSPAEPHWQGPILLDRPMQNLLKVESASGRARAATISDVLVSLSTLQAALVDPWLAAGWAHGRVDVAWQMTVIDTQAFGLTFLANRITKYTVARERPDAEGCVAGSSDAACSADDRNLSFFSGHTTVAATFAGLTCAHHQKLALYGSFAADLGACLGSVGLSLSTGYLRIASDNHWWSDVAVGQLVGFSAGYLLTWAHYYAGTSAPGSSAQLPVVVPIVGSGVLGLAVGGNL
jgi:membrane-associated phospholipid phosphatase